MKTGMKFIGIVTIVVLSSLILSACGAATPEPSPTVDIGAVQTSAVETFAVGLTQTAFFLPTETPTPSPTETPTAATPLGTPLPTVAVRPATPSCYGLTFVRDVTIPDNTVIAPGQAFTKTWLVRNSGTCPWDKGFKFAFVGGEAMDGATLTLDSAVNPGAEKELSIPMKAPAKTGSIRGTWRMSTAAGAFFGDEVFVLINVGNVTTTVTATVTRTTTSAATSTPTATTPAPTSTPTETPTTGP